jgi:hypothetical protein
VVQHVAFETLGTIEDVVRAQRLTPRYVRIHERDPIPSTSDGSCGLIVIAGPMNVEDSERLPHFGRVMNQLLDATLAPNGFESACLAAWARMDTRSESIGARRSPPAHAEPRTANISGSK